MTPDMTRHVRPATPQRYHQAQPIHCAECGTETPAGHVRHRDCPDPRRTR